MQVLAAFHNLRIITWDVVLKLGMDWDIYDKMVRSGRSERADFLEAIGRVGMAHDQSRDPDSRWLVCDPLAVAAAIDSKLITESKVMYL